MKTNQTRKPGLLRIFLSYFRPHWKLFLVDITCAVLVAAIDLAYVAAGRLSAVAFHYLYPWDFAAGWLIVSEAGGRLTLLDGGTPVLSGRSKPLLASNGLIHEEIIQYFGMAR